MKKKNLTLRLGQLAAALSLAFCVMPFAGAAQAPASFAEMVSGLPLVPAGTYNSDVLTRVTAAVDAIKRMDLPQAQLAVNAALQLDPRNAYLHFLNGFVYHLQAMQGDTQKGELALEGYQQAVRIDPSNWIAREFMGLAYMDLKQFDLAKLAFSDVLLMAPDSTVSIYGLMVAAYLTGDASTACGMADQFRRTTTDLSHGFVRSSVSVYASCGNFDQATRMRDALKHFNGGEPELEHVDRRLARWMAIYRKQSQQAPGADKRAAGMMHTNLPQLASNNSIPPLAQAFSIPDSVYQRAERAQSKGGAASEQTPAEAAGSASPAAPAAPAAAPVASGSMQPPPAPTPPSATPAEDAVTNGPRMLLVDVVLLSTQELISTSKGINLLSALTLQLGSISGNVAAYSRVFASNSATDPKGTTTITRAVTVPALAYSLNIANANNSVNEVLARPTLAAIENMPSEFFSGVNLSAGVVSTSVQGGTTVVPVDKRFGIKLSVTPTFLPHGQVQLKVEAQRTSLNPTLDNPRVAYQIEIAETTANANVVMKLGDTLVLSGLSEKSSSTTRDGVPVLQDVPVAQYLFSNKKTSDIQRSVLILVTPRKPVQLAESTAAAGESMATRMKALRDQFGFAGGNPSNMEAILTQLQSNTYFREFRQGDVSLERWDRMRSTGDRLQEALGFLYY